MTKKRVFLILTSLLAALLIGFLVFSSPVDSDVSLDRILKDGILRVGMDASYPPFESLDPQSGEMIGLDVDLANLIGEGLGVEVVLVNIAYDGLYDALLVGQVDLLISGLVAASEAYGKAEFSQPYFNAGEIIVTQSESPIQNIEDLASSSVGVEYGSGGDVEARQWQRRLEDLTAVRFNSTDEVIAALVIGEIDAAIIDGISAKLALAHNPTLTAGPYLNEKNFVIAAHPDADALRAQVGRVLDHLLESGEIDALVERWFS